MNATLRNLILATVAVVAPGCLHHHRIAPSATGLLACETRPGESACYESSRFDERGMLRHHVVERTTPADRCDLVVVEQTSYDELGTMIERVQEDRRCRVVDRRVTTRYDLDTGVIEHRVQRDDDHDDQLDHDQTTRVAMNDRVRTVALTSGRTQMAHIANSMAAQQGRVPGSSTLLVASQPR
jgi:hypothetical protein